MTCKDDCLCYNACTYHIDEETPMSVTECNCFKNKADFVEVVRCSECEYGKRGSINDKGFKICPASGMEITENDFCSYGERRTE